MSIVVDEAIWPFRGSKYCHMMSDVAGDDGVYELHAFAERLGLKRSWFQNRQDAPHYDVSENKREQAIRLGAKSVDALETVRIMRQWREMRLHKAVR